MTPRHVVRRGGEAAPAVPAELAGHSWGFRRWAVVSEDDGAVHTGFGISSLDPVGSVGWHVHSFEESVHVLEGEAVLETSEGAVLLREGDYGLVPVGVPHAWRGSGEAVARWADMAAPQPRGRFGGDTFFMQEASSEAEESTGTAGEPTPVDARDPRVRSFGHIEPGDLEVGAQTQDRLAVSASMRTALLVYSGITVKMMVDTDLGAQLSTMFMVQYEPAGVAGAHDHPFEETYLIVSGEVGAVFDGERYRLTAGDVAWTGAGCLHGFSNPGEVPVRWLETQAPQPPARHSYRFARDWDYLRDQLA